MQNGDHPARARREATFAGVYFALLLAYLFFHPESELEHWLSLVLIPLAGLWFVRGRPGLGALLASLGLERGRLLKGLGWPIALGLVLQGVQFLNPGNRAAVAEILVRPYGWIFPLVALPLLMVTVGPTEEVFFRGILQRRFSDAAPGGGWRADAWGIGLATVAFVLYHVPYAYLNPHWPSAGNLLHAVQLATVNGAMGGIVLGLVYVKSGRNLLAVILLHAMVDWVPGTILVSQVKFGGG
ncbi:MAG TPA: CPBP family intramembrane glutamic endopeptidase [Longimicrobiales bacterium]|nr:CPBP family intramembrane glutamic endopeptidase [Longimicrobiales bacterium]